jgi:ribosomal-protein-alanine N-acetyltransferase
MRPESRPRPAPCLPLATDRLLVRELVAADAADFMALYGDPRVTRHLLYGPTDAESAANHLEGVLRRQQSARRDTWELGIESRAGGRLVGACELMLHARDEAEVGYVLAHRCWGQGLGTEVTVALVGEAFAHLAVDRVLATVAIGNARSRHVLDKAGLRWEATLRRHARARRRWWDVHVYAVSREDWATARA